MKWFGYYVFIGWLLQKQINTIGRTWSSQAYKTQTHFYGI